MLKKLTWLALALNVLVVGYLFLSSEKIHYGGDIIEYFGMSESLINHASLELTEADRFNLVQRLGEGYFENPEYYIQGTDGQPRAVHFFVYSALNVPTRLLLRALGQDEYKTFRLTNLAILALTSVLVLAFFVKKSFGRLVFLVLMFLSPIAWYLVWPGPEVLSLCLLLLGIFCFFSGKKIGAVLLAAAASWHSQPMVVVAAIFALSYFWDRYGQCKSWEELEKEVRSKDFWIAGMMGLAMLVPNLYYLLNFGQFSAWAKLGGVGFENFSFKKFWELFFDLNIGLFWYMPVVFLGGLWGLGRWFRRGKERWFVLVGLVLLAVLYLVNNNWNNGTAGYGPTRYVLGFWPFLIYFYLQGKQRVGRQLLLLVLVLVSQGLIWGANGGLMPEFENTVKHTPWAKWGLNKMPAWYNPTAEIFVERTTEKEGGYWDTTIYKTEGKCKKAYVILSNVGKLEEECGYIPEAAKAKLVNEYLEIRPYSRKVLTTEATFYPAEGACAWDFEPSEKEPYVCMHELKDVKLMTGIDDDGRWEQIEGSFGAWKLRWGKPEEVVVPAGYIVNHFSFDGAYVNY